MTEEDNAEKTEKRNKDTRGSSALYGLLGLMGGFAIGSSVFTIIGISNYKKLESVLQPAIVYPFRANEDTYQDYLVVNERGDQFVFIGQESGYVVKSEKYLADKSESLRSELERRVINFLAPISYSQTKNSAQQVNTEKEK